MQTIIIQGHEYINIKIARSLTGYDETYLQKLAAKGAIEAVKIGRAWAIRKDSLMHYKNRHGDKKPRKEYQLSSHIKAYKLGHKMRKSPDGRVYCQYCQETLTAIVKGNSPCKKQ